VAVNGIVLPTATDAGFGVIAIDVSEITVSVTPGDVTVPNVAVMLVVAARNACRESTRSCDGSRSCRAGSPCDRGSNIGSRAIAVCARGGKLLRRSDFQICWRRGCDRNGSKSLCCGVRETAAPCSETN